MKVRIENWWKKEDSGLRARIFKASGSIDPIGRSCGGHVRSATPLVHRLDKPIGRASQALRITQSADRDRLPPPREEDAISPSRDLPLRSLRQVRAVTVAPKIAVEQQQFAIETAADRKRLAHKQRLLELAFNGESLLLEARLRASGATKSGNTESGDSKDEISATCRASWQRYYATVGGIDDVFQRPQRRV